MNPLLPPMFGSRSTPNLLDDVEMLQTDVMRFFAVLCLCLTAIFALVKALPLAPPHAASTIAEPADLQTRAEVLPEKAVVLKNTLREMQTRLRAATAAAERAATRADRAAEIERTLWARVAAAKQQLADTSQALADSRHAIEVRNLELKKIGEDIAGQRRVEAQLKNRIDTQSRQLALIRAEIREVRQKAAKASPAKVPPQPVASKGFALRFISDEALATLISDGEVKFYAIAAHKAWRLLLSGSRPVYIATELPRQIYVMEPATVPADYVALFQQQVAARDRHPLTWGVTLPGRTTASINSMIQGPKAGNLVITAAGEVKLK